jgi:hypothetical protein
MTACPRFIFRLIGSFDKLFDVDYFTIAEGVIDPMRRGHEAKKNQGQTQRLAGVTALCFKSWL